MMPKGENMRKFEMFERDTHGLASVISYAWPGGYPVFYVAADGGCLCPSCVESNLPEIGQAREYRDDQWDIVGQVVNYEDPALFCDHCGARIESAYAEDEVEA
jgi:hypothetical protein